MFASEYRTSSMNLRYKKFLISNKNEHPYVSINVGYGYSIRFYNSLIDWIDVVSLYKDGHCILSYKSKGQVLSQSKSKTFIPAQTGIKNYNSNYFSKSLVMVTPRYYEKSTEILNEQTRTYEKVDIKPFELSEEEYFFQSVLYELPPIEHIQNIREIISGCNFGIIPESIYNNSNISFYNATFDDVIDLDLDSDDFKLFSEKMKEIEEEFDIQS